jgi:hypothetical protein
VRIERLPYGLEVSGFEPDTDKKIFVPKTSRLALGQTQPLFNLYWSSSQRQGRDVDQSHPSSAEFVNEWSHTSIPSYVFMKETGTILLYLKQ